MTKPAYRILTEQGQLAARLNLIQGMVAKLVNETALAADAESVIARDTTFAMLRALRERVTAVYGDVEDTQPITLGEWMMNAEWQQAREHEEAS